MIPILYPADEKVFTSNGIGRLSDAIECVVTEERNGIYELFLRYPITGQYFSEIQHSRIIAAVPADGKPIQPFRIYKIEKPIDGICSIYAEHISYELNHIPVMPFRAGTCNAALNGLVQHSAQENPFSVWTDKNVEATFNLTHPEEFRALLGGVQGSILDVYGKGEYEFDKYLVKLHTNRGYNTGVTIRYAKNLVDLLQEESIEETITGVCPFWQNAETGETVVLDRKAVWSETAENFPYKRTAVIDFTDDFKNKPSKLMLLNRARKYIEDNEIGIPKVNLTISFVPLWQANGVSVGTPNPSLVLDASVDGDTLLDVDGTVTSASTPGATFADNDGNIVMSSSQITATESGGNVTIPPNTVLTFVDDGHGNITISGTDATSTLNLDARWEITYEDYKVLERVNLCDTVTVSYGELGVNATMKVVRTDYNVLLDRYDSIEVGDPKTDLAKTISGIQTEIENKINNQLSSVRTYIEHQTELINGGLGGYVVTTFNTAGQPQEILVMDTDDPATAVNVIRINKAGIGFSTTGYNGPFTSAWTIDGVFNTDFIQAGSIKAMMLAVDALTSANIALYGKMGVFEDSSLDTVGGFVGYMEGETASGNTTEGISLMSGNERNYFIATGSGVRMTNLAPIPGEMWISGGILEFRGRRAYIEGDVYLGTKSGLGYYPGVTRSGKIEAEGDITAIGKSGGTLVNIGTGTNEFGDITTFYNHKRLAYIGRQNYSGFVGVYNDGNVRANLGVNMSNHGTLTLYDEYGQAHTLTPALIDKLINL